MRFCSANHVHKLAANISPCMVFTVFVRAQNKDLEADLTATRLQLENSEREISRLKRLFAPKKKFNVRPRYLGGLPPTHGHPSRRARRHSQHDTACMTGNSLQFAARLFSRK